MNLEEKVIALISSNIEKKCEVTLASDLRKDLGVDSFGSIIIINAVEDAFGITVEENDFSTVKTVSDIVSLLKSSESI